MKSVFFIISVIITSTLFSQVAPIQWSFKIEKINETEYNLKYTAEIVDNWHLYGQNFPEGGPIRLSFYYNDSSNYEFIGKAVPSKKPKVKHEEVFNMDVTEFDGTVTFTQKIKRKNNEAFIISGELESQVCKEGSCMQFYPEFSFQVEKSKATETESTDQKPGIEKTSQKPDQQKIDIQNKLDPQSKTSDTQPIKETNPQLQKTQTPNISQFIQKQKTPDNTDNNALSSTEKEKKETIKEKILNPDIANEDLWIFFFEAILWGLLALLTPCVFPMIPMTVSFFMHGKKSKARSRFEALVFGLSIVFIYTILGTLVSIIFGAEAANEFSTHWLPNIIFFIIFMIFAASFLGMFEIVLPSWMVNKSDAKAEKGGITGAFFMALTLAIVSFSCTGPLVGTVLVKSSGGEFLKPIVGMLGFSVAFAVPFTLFAFFPSWLKSLPKSGGWLNSVKVVLGFLELALGLKFLSVADQTYDWGILDREIFLAFWIVIFTLMGFYLLGKIRFAHDSELKSLPVPRLIIAIITFSFVIYLFPGMFGHPLKMLAGYLPPMSTHDFNISGIVQEKTDLILSSYDKKNIQLCEKPKYSDKFHLPHGLKGYFDYEQGMACAKELNKPVFIDFTGKGCANCREMEANVWSDPRVLKRLREDYLIIALYGDVRTPLPEEEWITSTHDGKVKKTIGKKNADFFITNYQILTQPYYLLLDTNGDLLVEPRPYSLDVEEFVQFLDNGKNEFYKK